MSCFLRLAMRSTQDRREQGFVVLTSVILLCMAGILFTTNMVSSQLLDNQVMANYYRNSEAFVNAESGVHYVLSQLDDSTTVESLLASLPTTYTNEDHHYVVTVAQINARRLSITSAGTSVDSSAQREINLEVDLYFNFPTPVSTLSANGRLNLSAGTLINDGCEGLGVDGCQSSANAATNLLLSNPSIEIDDTSAPLSDAAANCPDGNSIEDGVLQGDGEIAEVVNGLNQVDLASLVSGDNTVDIGGSNCASDLANLSDEQEVIVITGDCDLGGEALTIGSSDHPKLVIMEGGTLKGAAGASIVGMLYLATGQDAATDSSIDLGTIKVNGALLSEYSCSYTDSVANAGNQQHLAVRFDKLVLDTLYSDLGVPITSSGHRLAVGTWRDF